MQTYMLTVTNTLTNCSNTDTLTILFAYSQCTYGISQAGDGFLSAIVPNPAHDKIRIQYAPSVGDDFKLSLHEITGRAVSRSAYKIMNAGNGFMDVDVSSLAKGMYLVRLENGEKYSAVKFIKR
jgi:hypothetical protein